MWPNVFGKVLFLVKLCTRVYQTYLTRYKRSNVAKGTNVKKEIFGFNLKSDFQALSSYFIVHNNNKWIRHKFYNLEILKVALNTIKQTNKPIKTGLNTNI
jgi:hypothetical protein